MTPAYRKATLAALVALGLAAAGAALHAAPAAAQSGNAHGGKAHGGHARAGHNGIAPSPARRAPSGKGAAAVQQATVTINRGYEPSTVRVKAGRPVRLVFVRKEQSGCGNVVQFPGLGIKRTLGSGEKTTVTFTPKKAGTVAFTCGMNMYQGKVVVVR